MVVLKFNSIVLFMSVVKLIQAENFFNRDDIRHLNSGY